MKSVLLPEPLLALMVPEFPKVIAPAPMLPEPWMVDELVRVSAPTEPKMKLFELLLRVRVPAPLRVVLALLIIRSVPFPAEPRLIVPAFLMLEPETVSEVLFEMVRLLPEARVKFLTVPAALSETAEPLLMMALVVLLGTPPDQFPGVFQSPLPSFQVVVWP